MRNLLYWARPRGGRDTILRAIRILVDYVYYDDPFQDYCKGTTILEEEDEEEHIFWAVKKLRRFVEAFEPASPVMARGTHMGSIVGRKGDGQK